MKTMTCRAISWYFFSTLQFCRQVCLHVFKLNKLNTLVIKFVTKHYFFQTLRLATYQHYTVHNVFAGPSVRQAMKSLKLTKLAHDADDEEMQKTALHLRQAQHLAVVLKCQWTAWISHKMLSPCWTKTLWCLFSWCVALRYTWQYYYGLERQTKGIKYR